MSNTSPLKRLWKLIRSEQSEIRNVYVFALFQGLVNLSLPLGIQAIINLLQAGQLRASWAVLVVFVLLGIFLQGMLQLRQMAITEGIEQRLFVNSSFDFAYRLPRASFDALKSRYFPEVMNRFFEVMTVQKGLSKLLLDFSTAVIQIVFGLILLSFYHPLFILLGLILALLLLAIFRFTGKAGMNTSLEESKHKFEVAHWLEELSRTFTTFKLSGKTNLPLDQTDLHTAQYLDARKRHFSILVIQFKALIMFKLLLAAALIIAGSVLVINGQINIGQFVAAEIVILLIIGSVEKIILNMNTVYDVLTALDKIGSITDIALEREGGIDISENQTTEGIHLKITNLSYTFSDATQPVIKNFSMEVMPGERICIAGPNGSGKTLLMKLITGYYSGYSGSITVDGLPIENVDLIGLRDIIGENFADQGVFKGTILENITCGRKRISMDDVLSATKLVNLHDYITQLPKGYETPVDPEGKMLSGGALRKIILARCFVGHPRLILMEDNLQSVLPDERLEIIKRMMDEHRKSTIVFISNNPAIQALVGRTIQFNTI
jgi:ABC-type bacteriocin/lantibiotic exporter with double-glycine peptidase domain